MIRRVIRHTYTFLSTHRAFHRAGVYALLLVGILELIARWPIDRAFVTALVDHPSLLFLDDWTWTAACTTALVAALIGLTRTSWLDRLAGLTAIWPAQQFLGFWLGFEDGLVVALHQEIAWWIVFGPLAQASRLAAGRESATILLFALYLAAVWLVLRVAFAISRERINRLGERLLRGATFHLRDESHA